MWPSSSCDVAHFQVCDHADQGGDALCLFFLWVLVPDERVTGMFTLSGGMLVVVVVVVDDGGRLGRHGNNF